MEKRVVNVNNKCSDILFNFMSLWKILLSQEHSPLIPFGGVAYDIFKSGNKFINGLFEFINNYWAYC